MIAFQAIMMPFLAWKLDAERNAQFILYVMIANILTVSLGNELGFYIKF